MDLEVRASSAPIFNSEGLNGVTALSNVLGDKASEQLKAKLPPRSAGYLNHDNSPGRLEFQDSKRSMDELKEFARTTPPEHVSSQPIHGDTSTAHSCQTDSERRLRVLKHITDSRSLPSKPLGRLLYRLSRSATTSDLSHDGIPRGSIEIASKKSSGGRKYMKIALNPKFYESENPSTYKINFQEVKAKGEAQKWIRHKSKTQGALEANTSESSAQGQHPSDDTDKYWKRVKNKYPHLILGSAFSEPAKSVHNEANNGYSPIKGIPRVPEPELDLNLQDFTVAALGIDEARTRHDGQVSTSPEKGISGFRQPGLAVQNHGNHAGRRRASSKGPYSVPIKFQMRPQRASLPKTPRTSLDEPATLKDSSPMVNGKAKASSTLSGNDSVATDGQSDAESAEIMNAQSAEFIRGQGTFGYQSRTSQKPPRSGPAPTRALPSLPEGRDNTTPKSTKAGKGEPSASVSQSVLSNSPKRKTPRSPPKGHRYRLSPVKNNICKDASTLVELKPNPSFSEEFPQPPRSLIPAAPIHCPVAALPHQTQEVDVNQAIVDLQEESSDLIHTVPVYHDDNYQGAINDLDAPQSVCCQSQSPHIDIPTQPSTDPDKDNLYLPWQESRVERVRALKHRDMERLRSHQEKVISPKPEKEIIDAQVGVNTQAKVTIACEKNSSEERVLSTRSTNENQAPARIGLGQKERYSSVETQNTFSPIITVAEQPPCLPNNSHPDSSYSYPSVEDNTTRLNGKSHDSTYSLPSRMDGHPPSHLHLPSRGSPSPHPKIHRIPSYSSATAGRQEHSSSRPNSHISITDVEARIASLEKKNLLLERAFMAVIDATSSGFSLASRLHGRDVCGGFERDSYPSFEEEVERRRASAASEVLAPLVGKVEGMLMAMQGGRGKS